jgi:hypothetical protein
MYRANIEELHARDGRFRVWGEGIDLISDDPEYEFCHRLCALSTQDGQIEFLRSGVTTHRMKSVLRAGRARTSMGNTYPKPVLRRAYGGPK